jgi:hypothetical protein
MGWLVVQSDHMYVSVPRLNVSCCSNLLFHFIPDMIYNSFSDSRVSILHFFPNTQRHSRALVLVPEIKNL